METSLCSLDIIACLYIVLPVAVQAIGLEKMDSSAVFGRSSRDAYVYKQYVLWQSWQ
jgi:hypothetical protein